jgi:hypothetical protein
MEELEPEGQADAKPTRALIHDSLLPSRKHIMVINSKDSNRIPGPLILPLHLIKITYHARYGGTHL